ncbi:hypothetical protein BH20ACT19_BH20ACT19_07910 [soil metagenome]
MAGMAQRRDLRSEVRDGFEETLAGLRENTRTLKELSARSGFEETLAGLRENTRTLKELSAQIAAQREEFVAESRTSRATFLRELDARLGPGEGRGPSPAQ